MHLRRLKSYEPHHTRQVVASSAGQLFGVTPRDPVAIVAALSVMAIVTIAAGYVPARRASRIDPVRALRAE